MATETGLQQKSDETGKIVPSPAHNATEAKNNAIGVASKSEKGQIKGSGVLIGTPSLMAKQTITIDNIGKKLSGNWRVKMARHIIVVGGGYKTEFEVEKSSANDGNGQISASSRGNSPKEQPAESDGRKYNLNKV